MSPLLHDRPQRRSNRFLVSFAPLSAALLFTAGCAGDFVEQPELRQSAVPSAGPAPSADAEPADLSASLDALFVGADAPGAFVFCEAVPETGQCEDENDGLSASGVGGVLLPLFMEVSGMTVLEAARDGDGWTLTSDFDAAVNGIPPLCDDADGRASINPLGSANIDFGGFYCNWLVIGNVITQVELSVDFVDPAARAFTGYYALQFNGTGNAGGSGYYRAEAVAVEEGAPLVSQSAPAES